MLKMGKYYYIETLNTGVGPEELFSFMDDGIKENIIHRPRQ